MQPVFVVQDRPYRLSAAAHLARYQLRVTWIDGASEIVDIEPLIFNHRSLMDLREDSAAFRDFTIAEGGARLIWSNGCSLSAKAIARLPRGEMDNNEFRALQAEMNLSTTALAAMLGLSRRAITGYRASGPVPKAVALAMRYIHERWDA